MPIAKTLSDVQNTAFDQLVAAQNKIVEVNRDLAGRLGGLSDRLPALPMMDEAREANRSLVDSVFTWSTKLMEASRSFTNELLSVWAAPAAGKSTVKSAAAAK